MQSSKSKKNINYSALKEVAEFYNSYTDLFCSFESKTGVNPWFLEHLRIYVEYSNTLFNNITEGNQPATKNEYVKANYFFEIKTILSHIKLKRIQHSSTLLLTEITQFTDSKHRILGDLQDKFECFCTRNLLIKNTISHGSNLFLKKHNNSDNILFWYLFSLSNIKRIFTFSRDLNKLLTKIKTQLKPEHELIFELFNSKKKSILIYYLRYLSFNHFFNKNKIKKIILTDENSPQNKVIQYAAINNNIKTFAVQHGTIHELHPNYMYGHYVHKPKLPFKTLVWGASSKELLTNICGYTENQVEIIGYINSHSKTIFISPKINNLKTKIAVFATQPQKDESIRVQQLKDVFTVFKTLNDYTLVIRPHPAEKDDNYFSNIAKELNIKNYLLDRQSSLKGHFECCDLLITAFSTVGMEFIQYNKPLIILDYLSQDLIGYIKENVGLKVESQDDLKSIMNSKLIVNKQAYEKFIEKYFYKIDGKPEERLLETVINS